MNLTIRPFEARDTERLIAILERVFGEYGMRFDPDGFDRDVRSVAERYAEPTGVFYTAHDSGTILGFGGADLPAHGVAEIHRLYIDPDARGLGLGRLLVDTLEAWARPRVPTMTLWSDVRFFHAHDLYARLGYRLTGQRRLGDPDRSTEFGFTRSLSGPRDDRPFDLELEHVPLARRSAPGDAHEAGMLAAAIVDSRTLPRGPDGAHEVPDPISLFTQNDASPLEAVIQRPGILVGFRRGKARRLHPLFSSRVVSR